MPLFADQVYIENWLKNWRDNHMRFLEEYKIHTIAALEKVSVRQDFHTDVFSFYYWYKTDEGESVRIVYNLSDYRIDFREGDISIEISEKVKELFELSSNGLTSHPTSQDKLMQYAELFYRKTEDYLTKTNRILLGSFISTKLLRMTADNLNQKEEILLNKSALQSAELDDLLK